VRSLRINQHPILGSLNSSIDFRRIGHPRNELRGVRKICHQVSKNLLRCFYEEPVCHALWLVEGDSQGLSFGFAAEFIRGIPIGHPSIQWVEYDVAPSFVIKLLHKLTSRIVNNSAVASVPHLIEHLPYDARLAGTGITDNEKVLVFGVTRYTQRAAVIVRGDTDAVAGHGVRELARAYQNWPFSRLP